MPARSIIIYPFSLVYVGNYGSSDVLTRVTALRTRGASIEESFPTQWLRCLDDAYSYNTIQSDFHTARVTLAFYCGDDMTVRLTRGLSISADINDPPGNANYILLLVAPSETDKESYFLPRVRVEKVREVRYSKEEATVIEVTFLATARNPNTSIIYKNTPAALDSTMGAVSPL
jgi:hypothetical protein